MKILTIELLSDNLTTTEDFYTNILGLEVLEKNEDLVSFKAGESILAFKRSFNRQPCYHFAFNIPHDTLDEAFFWVSSKTPVMPVSENEMIADFSSWNARAFYLYDNNHNVLEFIARFDLQEETNEPFTASVISCISEIGIVADNVKKYTNELSKLTGVPDYSKQPRQDNFTALGDDNGLFIISAAGRNWFPTKKKAAKFYTKIKISTGEALKEITLHEETGVE